MLIEFRPLLDNTYYRDVKGIFSTAFANNFSRDTIIRAWKSRDKQICYAFYHTVYKKIIGFVMMRRKSDTMFYLSFIAISEEFKGKGIGTDIMKGLLKWAADQRCSMSLIPLGSVASWYKSLGFSKTCDEHLLVFHNHGTRKQAKYIKALDEEKPKYIKALDEEKSKYIINKPMKRMVFKIGVTDGWYLSENEPCEMVLMNPIKRMEFNCEEYKNILKSIL